MGTMVTVYFTNQKTEAQSPERLGDLSKELDMGRMAEVECLIYSFFSP